MKRLGLPSSSIKSKQHGVVMVMTAIALVALIGAVGMALDGGHILLSKTRLQNAVDSAALSAAKTLNLTGDYTSAIDAAHEIFALNASQSKELFEAGDPLIDHPYDNLLQIEFSETLVNGDFKTIPSSGSKPRFVRVIFENLDLDLWLIQVTGVDSKRVSASAVSGPSPPLIKNVCDVAPILLCEEDSSDPKFFGYKKGDVHMLKLSSDDTKETGEGNFQLLSLDGSGVKNVMENAAGANNGACVSTENEIPTEPGNSPVPFAAGINTRFGIHEGPLKKYQDIFPGDLVPTEQLPYLIWESVLDHPDGGVIRNSDDNSIFTGELNYGAADYITDSELIINDDNNLFTEKSPEYRRRVITVPVGECGEGDKNGKSDILVKGFLCLYIVQHMATPQHPTDGNTTMGTDNALFAEVVDACNANGTFTDSPTYSTSPVNIVLHNDPGRQDS